MFGNVFSEKQTKTIGDAIPTKGEAIADGQVAMRILFIRDRFIHPCSMKSDDSVKYDSLWCDCTRS